MIRAGRTPAHHERLHMADNPNDRLTLLVERIENLELEKKGIAEDISEVYAEAKAVGYDTKIMRHVIKLRKMGEDERASMQMLVDTYKNQLGMADQPTLL